jgi:hypothetical protein
VSKPNFTAINRITALWALSESGLGGLMHAIKTPFTGFFVGGFAVICIALIAHYSQRNFRIILQSAILVILVKATVSPHSPVTAHFAVLFQGFTGALFYSFISSFSAASILSGFIALLESAVQKVLILTLIFGNSLWEALDLFTGSVLKSISVSPDFSFSTLLVISYVAIYSIWGVALGFWISKLPSQIDSRYEAILKKFIVKKDVDESSSLQTSKKGSKKILILVLILVFIVTVFALSGSDSKKGIFIVLRTLASIALLFYFVQPVLKWLLNQWLSGKSEQEKTRLQNILDVLPEMKSLVKPAFVLASENKSGIKKYHEFVLILIILSLNPVNREQ